MVEQMMNRPESVLPNEQTDFVKLGLDPDAAMRADVSDVVNLVAKMSQPGFMDSESANDEFARRQAQSESAGNGSIVDSWNVARTIIDRANAEYHGDFPMSDRLGGAYGTIERRALTILERIKPSLAQQPERMLQAKPIEKPVDRWSVRA